MAIPETDIDTAEIRGRITGALAGPPLMSKWLPSQGRLVLDLLDALDAARAERDDKEHEADHWSGWAETYKERAKAAEARIAAARSILRDAYDRGDFEAIERALTGDTE